MADLSIFLLGTPRIEKEGIKLRVQRKKSLALLAYLSVSNQSHLRETLATFLWPEHDYTSARNNLRRTLSDLKETLGSAFLEVDRQNIRIADRPELWVDFFVFQQLLSEVRNHRHPKSSCPDCIARLTEAVQLYKGDFMAGFNLPDCPDFDDWQFFIRERLRTDLSAALQWLIQESAKLGDYETAIPYAQQWVSLDKAHEPAHTLLMRLYAGSGQYSAALRQYHECELYLKHELGVQPQENTCRLYQAILERRVDFDRYHTEPKAFEISQPRNNLPLQTIPFIWRDEDMREIINRLNDPNCRLLSLLGPGGCGKTRLAIEAGNLVLNDYPDGVFFVSLEPIDTVDAIVPAIAEAIGFSFSQSMSAEPVEPRKQLINYLRYKTILLILDNYEHLLEGIGLAIEILKFAPKVKIVATSRSRLNVFEEHAFMIPGMKHPDYEISTIDEDSIEAAMKYEAIQLFIQSAYWAYPGFKVSSETLPSIIRICQMLIGMPLGIILAAAWLRLLSLQEIEKEIYKGLDLLEAELRDLPDRQRSIRAVFNRSWIMLNEREQQLFASMSVFRGGCTREAARFVIGASLQELRTLVDRSFLQRDLNGRFSLHRLLRYYGAERLTEIPQIEKIVRDRHSVYFAGKLQGWQSDLKGTGQASAIAEMDLEVENCKAAWEWSVEQKRMDHLQNMCESLFLYNNWRQRYKEGAKIFGSAAEKLRAIPSIEGLRILPMIIAYEAILSFSYSEPERCELMLEEAQRILNDQRLAAQDVKKEQATLLRLKGYALVDTSRSQEANRCLKQSLILSRELEDNWAIGKILFDLGRDCWWKGESNLAISFYEESVNYLRKAGDLSGLSLSLSYLGTFLLTVTEEYERGENILREALEIQRRIGEPLGSGFILLCLAMYVYFRVGQFIEAEPLLEECTQIVYETGDMSNWALGLASLGDIKLGLGDYDSALQFFAKSMETSREIDNPRGIVHSSWGLTFLSLLHGRPDQAAGFCQEAISIGERGFLPQNEIAWIHAAKGTVACINNSFSLARESLLRALRIEIEIHLSDDLKFTLPPIALFKTMCGQIEAALELYTFAKEYFPFISKARFMEDIYGKRILSAVQNLPSDIIAAAKERGRNLDLWEMANKLLVELEENEEYL
jgi:DNA-binding SARP family transcriptional activator/predicted ATPase